MGRIFRLAVLLAILIPRVACTQTMDCEQTIAHATDEFNAGHFYSIPAILNECLKKFSRNQRQRAFLLLTQTYLLLDDPIGAQKSFLEILWANPEFIADEQLHAIDIVYLSKRFTATPKFSWFVRAGSNVSPVRLILDNDAAADVENYILRPGYQVGLGGEYSYDDNLKIRAEVDYLNTSYRSNAIYIFGQNKDTKDFIDRQSGLSIPLYVSYADNIGTYRPYGYAGYALSLLLNDRGLITLKNVDGTGDERVSVEDQSPDLNLLDKRNKINHSLIFGGGVKYKVGLDFIFAELRYSVGLKNMVNPERSNSNYSFDPTTKEWVDSFTPLSAYRHVDDYFRLDNLSISFGFIRPLYKPREVKRARTKGVLRKMKKSK